MLAVDTNVVVRFLVRDEPVQSARAGALMRGNAIWLAKTVLLETEWVLRSVYGYAPSWIAAGLRQVTGLPQVDIEDEAAVAQAFEWFEAGLDFADALHLASSGKATALASFDRKLALTAKRLRALPVIAP